MDFFAEIDENNEVVRCVVADSLGWCVTKLGGNWVVNPKNDSAKNSARIGWTYDDVRVNFIPPQPYESWVLDEGTCLWVAPVPMPEDGGEYVWNEEAGDWVAVPEDAVE